MGKLIMLTTIEKTILSQLIYNEDYTRKVLPFLKGEYFSERTERVIFEEIQKFVDSYNNLPTQETLQIELDNRRDLNENEFKNISELVDSLEYSELDDAWLIESTEKFCKDKAVYNAILRGINIIQGKDKKHSPDSLPDILSEALAVGFDTHIGHDYIEDGDRRFDFYHQKEEKMPFDLEFFNKITNGGVSPKTLNIVLAGTGSGKSLFMCHMAASCLLRGHNVLYITLEMAEERIAERIDANLLNVPIHELENISKRMFDDKLLKVQEKTRGKLIIKEYPTAAAHAGHFRALIRELNLKKSFIPEIIFIDYLNICASSRFKENASIGSYTYVKSIAEELRGLAVEMNVPIFSATQTTRSGYANSDIELTDTSECIFIKEKIQLRDGTIKEIGDVKVGDQIISNDGYKTVQLVHHKKMKKCFKIKTKSGKEIIVSEDHVFPTEDGRMSLKSGLKVGLKLNSI